MFSGGFSNQWGDDEEEEEVASTITNNRGNPFGGAPASTSAAASRGNPFGGSSPSRRTSTGDRRDRNKAGNPFGPSSGSGGTAQSSTGNPFGSSSSTTTTTRPGANGASRAPASEPSNPYAPSSSHSQSRPLQQQKQLQKPTPRIIRDTHGEPLLRLRVVDGWTTGSGKRPVIRAVAAAHRTLAIATEEESVLWWDTSTGGGPKKFDLASRGGRSIESIFLDPTGHHLIISMVTGDNYYLHSSFDRVRSLKKLSNVHVQSVAWDKRGGSETSTQTILVGGRTGDIYEAQLDPRKKDKYWKQVYQLDDEVPVCGLEYESFPDSSTSGSSMAIVGDEGDSSSSDSSSSSGRGGKYFVMAVTAQPTRYYQFVGGPTFELLFQKFGQGKMPARFNEFGTDVPYSELHFFSKN